LIDIEVGKPNARPEQSWRGFYVHAATDRRTTRSIGGYRWLKIYIYSDKNRRLKMVKIPIFVRKMGKLPIFITYLSK
jgi:hypothetical protein